jgi:hypothetical protein
MMLVTVLLIVHGLLAVTLLGALTHQAFAVAPSMGRAAGTGSPRSFLARFSGVNAAAYANPIIVLFVLTTVLGVLLYPDYRIDVRWALESMQMKRANGAFEIKEHLVAVGLGLLPAYWLAWSTPLQPEHTTTRRCLTWMLTLFVWWGFLVGHVLNNIKGLLPA